MKKTAFYLMLITVISKFLGFFRDVVLSYFYGATGVTDAYLISKTIPSFMFMFIGTAIVTGYIPVYTKIENEKGVKRADDFTSKMINALLLICTIILILVFLYTENIVKLFASGFTDEIFILAVRFTRVNIFTIYLTVLIYIFRGYLEIKGNYLVPVIMGIPLNIIIVISILMSSKYSSTIILPIGNIIATLVQLLFMIPWLLKNHYKHKFRIDLHDKNIVLFYRMAIPTIVGVSVNEINILVDRTIASRITLGGITSLNYANQINQFVNGIFVISLITIMFPAISKLSNEKNIKSLIVILRETINGVNLFVIPASIGLIVFSREIINLMYGRGAFTNDAAILTASALTYYSVGMIGIGLREVISRVFFALHDMRTPMKNASIGMALNIVLNVLLSFFWGIGGLALATSISAILTSILMFISLRKKIGPFGMKQISISFLKILFASLVMGGLAKMSFNYLTASLSQNLSLLLAIGVGAVSYFVIIYFMKIEDVDVIVGAIKKKLGRGAA
jgi:putative peptidoglycan lipid II flippase